VNVNGESFVFEKYEWQKLSRKIKPGKTELRNTYTKKQNSIVYEENIEYEIDYNKSMIRRCNDNIKDFSLNPLYGLSGFDHTDYPDYGNGGYTYYLDYSCENYIKKTYASCNLKLEKYISQNRLSEVKMLVYGDSISTGAEASEPKHMYYNRFANRISDLFKMNVTVQNLSVGGDSTKEGLKRLDNIKELDSDIAIISFGMNDHNLTDEGTRYVEPNEYAKNIQKMIDNIYGYIILVSPCIPNPLWKYSSNTMYRYRDILKGLATKNGITFVDVYEAFNDALISGKNCESLLTNNINHPNDYGHYIYYSVLEEIIGI